MSDTGVSAWYKLCECPDGQHEDTSNKDKLIRGCRRGAAGKGNQKVGRPGGSYHDNISFYQWTL